MMLQFIMAHLVVDPTGTMPLMKRAVNLAIYPVMFANGAYVLKWKKRLSYCSIALLVCKCITW